MVMLGDDFKSFKDDTQYKNSKLSMTSFMQQEEERAFFWLSPANPHGQRNVFAHIPAFIPEPTQEVRSLLPYVDWQQELPYNPEQAFPTADDPSYDEDQDATAAGQITPSSVAPLDPALVTKPFWQDAALLNIMQEPADSSTSAPGPATKEVLIPVKASDAQGAKAHNQCFLFDMVKELPGATPFLKQLIENPRIVKVLHDCRQDAAALLVQKGISLRNVYDTQVAYGLVSCWRSQLGSQQTIRRLGLQDLLKRVGLRAHQSKSDVRAKMAEDPNLWQHRPLASELQQYAAADVSQLLAVADRSSAMLGTVGQEVVRVLSQASCQLKLPVMPGTQVTNLEKLPHNVQTELRFYNNADGVCCDPVFTVLSPADQASISAEHPSTDDFADTPDERSNADDMADILELVPETIRAAINAHLDSMNSLYPIRVTGIVADVGRPVRIRFDSTQKGTREYSLSVDLDIAEAVQALKGAQKQLQTGRPADYFGVRNRMSLRGSLHRISAMKGDQGDIQGLTYRVGRHISGKTTLLRDITHMLADTFKKVVIVVDPSQEIAGGGQVPHSCIGSARRMTGTTKQSKHEVLQEAVTNHGPEVIVVDEVYNAKEVAAMADIARCGVAMVATVHGTSLQTLLDNRTLNNLLGGKQEVIVGDQQASNDRKGPSGTRKTRQERREAPLFATVIEVCSHDRWYVYDKVANSVDALLAGKAVTAQLRKYSNGRMVVSSQYVETAQQPVPAGDGTAVDLDWIDDLFEAAQQDMK
ncbi:TPA: PFAM ATPase associated with various cellular activities (AAA) [Trebouxia sp. C0006]